jgi:TRAP-type C4-dicarboxylate transport system permease small subunit
MSKKGLMGVSERLSTVFEIIAGVALVGVMVLTGCDIVGRAFGHPIRGTYEIVSFAGGIIIGLATPITSLMRGHVLVDLLTTHVSERTKNALHVITRFMVIILFLLLSYALANMGESLRVAGETTSVLSLPFYPVAYGVSGACLVECLILACDILRGGGELHE